LGKLIGLFTVTLLATLIFASTALALDDTNETTGGGDPFFVAPKSERTAMEGHTMTEGTTAIGKDLVDSGGPSVLLPAAALLLGSSILGYAILIRRG
jgi:hypothetical protein